MLLSISIKNFILIDSINLEFDRGFYTITGETGAGKSILLDAILFVLGENFDLEIVKAGSEEASVTAEFSCPIDIHQSLEEFGITLSDTIIIKRIQKIGGKKKILINDEQVTIKALREISANLIEMHGQHSHSELLEQSKHLRILDQFASLKEQSNIVNTKYNEWQKLERDIAELEKHRETIIREIDFLNFTVDELSKKVPEIGEEEKLANLRIDLQNASKNQELLSNLESQIQEYNITGKILNIERTIERGSKNTEKFKEILEKLRDAYAYMDEAEKEISSLSSSQENINLDEVETRLFEIRGLARKYNVIPDELPKYLIKSQTELENLRNKVENADELKQQVISLKASYLDSAKLLSSERKIAAKTLEEKIGEELTPLKMKGCVWQIEFSEKSENEYGANGIDNVRFIASTNPGMAAAPIDKIASGGELARLMLAVKVVLFDKFTKPTIIFDEIDTGIGGSVADAIGARLSYLGKASQVLAITHQPQVVAKSDHNILVTKHTDGHTTSSSAKILSREEKKSEIARMLSGQKITEGAMAAAQELMER
ncbi:MAG: repair protein RecN [Pseudomonadota bacterium]